MSAKRSQVYRWLLLAGWVFANLPATCFSEVNEQGIQLSAFGEAAKQIESQNGDWSSYQRALEYATLVRQGYAIECEARFISEKVVGYQQAANCYERACELIPTEPVAHFLAAQAYYGLGRFGGKAARHLLVIQPESEHFGHSRALLSRILAHMATVTIESTDSAGVVTLNDSIDDFLLEQGEAVTDKSRERWLEQAQAAYQAAQKLLHGHPDVLLTEGYLLSVQAHLRKGPADAQGRAIAAYREYLKQVKVDSTNWRVVTGVARTIKEDLNKAMPEDAAALVETYRQKANAAGQSRRATRADNADYAAQAVIFLMKIPASTGVLKEIRIQADGSVGASFFAMDVSALRTYVSTSPEAQPALRQVVIMQKEQDAKSIELSAILGPPPRSDSKVHFEKPMWQNDQEKQLRQSMRGILAKAGWRADAQVSLEKIRIDISPPLVAWECRVSREASQEATVIELLRDTKGAFGTVPTACAELKLRRVGENFSIEYAIRSFYWEKKPEVPQVIQ